MRRRCRRDAPSASVARLCCRATLSVTWCTDLTCKLRECSCPAQGAREGGGGKVGDAAHAAPTSWPMRRLTPVRQPLHKSLCLPVAQLLPACCPRPVHARTPFRGEGRAASGCGAPAPPASLDREQLGQRSERPSCCASRRPRVERSSSAAAAVAARRRRRRRSPSDTFLLPCLCRTRSHKHHGGRGRG